MRGTTVCKSNSLVQAGYKLGLNEQRILLSCISQVDSKSEITDEVMYSISVKQIARHVGCDPNNLYRDIKGAALRLMDSRLKISHSPEGNKLSGETLVTSWVQSLKYCDSSATVAVRFPRDLIPYLSQLQTQFTRYSLKNVMKMSSMYGIRLYELIVQYRNMGKREIEFCWLREQLQLGNDKYVKPNDLKRFVIEPAIRDINTHSDLKVKCEYKKTGRRTSHIVLTFKEKRTKITSAYIQTHARPGETWDQAATRLSAQ